MSDPPDLKGQMVQALLALGQEAGLELSYDAESFALLVAPQGQLLLDNVFAAFQNAPDEQRRGILDGALGMVSEFANAMPQSWATAQRRIVPRVRSRSYYELFQLQMAATGLEGGNSTPPWVALGEWLAVALCIDLPHSLRDVHPEHLQEWGVDFGQAMEQALRNLRGFRQAPLVPLGDGCFRGSWGDHMDASRLLLPDLIQALCGEEHPIIAVPSRDTMLLAGAASLVQLRHQVVENFSQADHTLSPVPLRWNGGSWEDFLTPEMSQLAKFATAAEYGHQAKLLTALFKHTGNSLFPATVQIYTVPETDETATLCIWNEGVESLLPRTDVLALMARESQQPTFVLWEQALVSLADVLVAQEGRPVLYRTGAFPGPERLSSVPQVDPRNPFQPRVAARVADMVLPLQVHLCSQQSSEAWTARLEEVNVLFAPAGIRFDPEIESLEVPEGAWLNAMSEEAHCAGLLNLPEVRPGVLQIFCLSQIPEAGYLFRESLVILAGDRVSPAVLASHLGCALGLSERPTFRRAERRVLRFRAQRLLAICASQRLDVTVHRMSSISQAQVVEALEFAGVHLEKLGISLLIRAVLSERIAAETLGQPEQLCQLDTFVENSVNLFLIEEIAGAPPIQVHPELPLVLVTPPAESPLHEVLTEALLLPLRTQRDQLLQAPTLHIPLQVQLVVHPQLGASATVSEVEQLLDETNEIWAPTGVRFEAEISSLEVADAPLQAVLPNAPELGSVSRRADCLPLLELDGVRPGVLQLFVLSHLPHLGGEAPSNSAGYFFHSGVMLLPSDLGQSVAVFQRLLGRCLGLGPRPGDEQSIMGKGRSFLLEELLLLRHTTQRQVLREFSPCLPVFVHQAYNEEFGTALGEASRQAEILLAFEAAALTLSSAGVMLWLRGVLNTTVSNQTLANPAALAKNRHRDAGSINVFVVRQLPAQLSGPWLTLVPQRLILVRREGPLSLDEALVGALAEMLEVEMAQLHAGAERFRVIPLAEADGEEEEPAGVADGALLLPRLKKWAPALEGGPLQMAIGNYLALEFCVDGRALSQHDLDSLGISQGEALQTAVENLTKKVRKTAHNVHCFDDACKILSLASFSEGRFVALATRPDASWLADAEHPEALREFLEIAAEESAADVPLSALPLLWNGSAWSEYRCYQTDPMAPLLARVLRQAGFSWQHLEMPRPLPMLADGERPEIVLPLQVHQVVHAEHGSQRPAGDWVQLVDEVNGFFAGARVRFQAEIAPLPLPDAALPRRDRAPGVALLDLPGLRRGVLQLFCVRSLVPLGEPPGQRWRSPVLFVSDDLRPNTAAILSRQLGRLLGVDMDRDETHLIRYEGARLLANQLRYQLPVKVHLGEGLSADAALELVRQSSGQLEPWGCSLTLRSIQSCAYSSSQLDDADFLRSQDSWDEGALNLFLMQDVEPVLVYSDLVRVVMRQDDPEAMMSRLFRVVSELVRRPDPNGPPDFWQRFLPLTEVPLQIYQVNECSITQVEPALAGLNDSFRCYGLRFRAQIASLALDDETIENAFSVVQQATRSCPQLSLRPGWLQIFLFKELPQPVALGAYSEPAILLLPDSLANLGEELYHCFGAGPFGQAFAMRVRRWALKSLGVCLSVTIHLVQNEDLGTTYGDEESLEQLLDQFQRASTTLQSALVSLHLREIVKTQVSSEELRDPTRLHWRDQGIPLLLVRQMPSPAQASVFVQTEPPLIILGEQSDPCELWKALAYAFWPLLGLGGGHGDFSAGSYPHLDRQEAALLYAAGERMLTIRQP